MKPSLLSFQLLSCSSDGSVKLWSPQVGAGCGCGSLAVAVAVAVLAIVLHLVPLAGSVFNVSENLS